MSIPYVPPRDDSLDTHVEDLDSFKLSDVYMSDGDAETKIFGSNHSSSSCEPDSICVSDTTTSPPSKIKPPDPSRQRVEKHTDYKCFCCHPKVAKFNSLFSLKSSLPGCLPYPIGLGYPREMCIYEFEDHYQEVYTAFHPFMGQ